MFELKLNTVGLFWQQKGSHPWSNLLINWLKIKSEVGLGFGVMFGLFWDFGLVRSEEPPSSCRRPHSSFIKVKVGVGSSPLYPPLDNGETRGEPLFLHWKVRHSFSISHLARSLDRSLCSFVSPSELVKWSSTLLSRLRRKKVGFFLYFCSSLVIFSY